MSTLGPALNLCPLSLQSLTPHSSKATTATKSLDQWKALRQSIRCVSYKGHPGTHISKDLCLLCRAHQPHVQDVDGLKLSKQTDPRW